MQSSLTALALLVCFGSLPRLGLTQTETVESLAARARQAEARADFSSAAALYEKLLELAPDLHQARSNLGMMYYLNGEYEKAVASFEQALKADPRLHSARVFLGVCLLEMDRIEEAIPHLEKSVQEQSEDRLARLHLARTLHLAGRNREALNHLERLREEHEHDPELLYQLGRVYMKLSIEAYETLKARDPQNFRISQLLGENYEMQGLYGPAIANYSKALEKNPAARGMHLKIGDLHKATGDPQKAREAYRQEILTHPGSALGLFKLARLLLDEGETEEACSLLERSVAAAENFSPSRLALGRCLLLQNRTQAALDQLLKAVALAPDEPSGYYQLAQVYQRLGRVSEAREALQTYQKLQSH